MNTEPPTGDDLQRMLVSMKQTVLDRAEDRRPAPRRRGGRAGIVIGVIALLGLGATSGGVALGMIPQPFTASAPAPTPSPSEPVAPSTPESAPVQETPDPVPTPTPTSTRGPFALDDPSTWTISGDEIGPIALGGQFDAEVDDLGSGTVRPPIDDGCPAPGYGAWTWDDGTVIEVLSDLDGVVRVVRVIGDDSTLERSATPSGPHTAGGSGRGAALTAIRSEYPDIHPEDAAASGPWSLWQTSSSGGTITFEIGADAETVVGIKIGDPSQLPRNVCD